MEETPQSQRITQPSPQPFQRVAPRVRSPGEYRIVNDDAVEEQPSSTRRSPRLEGF